MASAVEHVAGYAIWVRGTRGPELQRWEQKPSQHSEYWRTVSYSEPRVLCDPIPLCKAQMEVGLDVLKTQLPPAPVMV